MFDLILLEYLKTPIFIPDPKSFTFDGVYGTDSTTEAIYNDNGFALVEGVLEGYNGTVFAYGQTGCGKSFSMQVCCTVFYQYGCKVMSALVRAFLTPPPSAGSSPGPSNTSSRPSMQART